MKPVYLLLGLSLMTLLMAGCSSSEQPVPSAPTPDLEATNEAEKKEDVSPTPTRSPTNDKDVTLDPQQIIIERKTNITHNALRKRLISPKTLLSLRFLFLGTERANIVPIINTGPAAHIHHTMGLIRTLKTA